MDSLESNRQVFAKNYGLTTDVSRFDLPWGAFTTLDNLQDVMPGELRTRKGLAPAPNFTDASPTSHAIQSLEAFPGPLGPTIVTVDANGVWRARRAGLTYSIATGLGTSAPWRFCRTRDAKLIAINGLERGFIWYGSNSTAVDLGVDAPTANLTIALASTGGLSEGDYQVAYRYVDKNTQRADYAYSEMSAVETYTAADGQKFNWDFSSVVPAPGRATHVQGWRTGVGETTVFYLITEQAVGSATTFSDTATDQDLIAAAADDPNKRILLRNPFGVAMRRFTPPPKTKGSVVQHLDRFFFGVDVPYDTGTVSIASGDPTLTGSGTTWTSDFVGRWVWIEGASKPYVISTFTNATSVELNANGAETLNGKAYKILPDPAERNQVFYSALDEPESVPITFTFTVQAAQEDDDEMTALMPFGRTLFCLKNRHAYAYEFSIDPAVDGRSQYAYARGCLNQACWDQYAGTAYVLDAAGAYAVGPGGSPEPISDAVQGYWRDGTIDFSAAKWFHVHANHADKIVRFFVKFTGDSGTRPTRVLSYHTVHRSWAVENYVHEIAGCARIEESGVVKTVVGANHDRLYYLASGELDGASSQIRGTVTGATATTLTDSSAPFGSSNSLVGASVAIWDGTAFVGYRRITANTSSELTVATWGTTPAVGDKYIVGGYPYKLRTGGQPVIDQARKEEESIGLHLTVAPVTNQCDMHVREFWDFDATAESLGGDGYQADRLVSWERNATDKKVQIHLTAKTNESGTGVNRGRVTVFDYAKAGGGRLQGKSHVAIEVEGAKGSEQIVIHRMDLSGTGKQ